MANLKLLLIEDVEALGRSGDIVTVRPGYARNFLIPQQLALIADKQALSRQARLQEERKKKAVADKEESENLSKQLEGVSLSITVKVDHEGHMYGSVSAQDIINLLHNQKSIHIEKRSILLPHPLREIGEHTVTLKLKEGITSSILISIQPEQPLTP